MNDLWTRKSVSAVRKKQMQNLKGVEVWNEPSIKLYYWNIFFFSGMEIHNCKLVPIKKKVCYIFFFFLLFSQTELENSEQQYLYFCIKISLWLVD